MSRDSPSFDHSSRVYVAGHRGLLGSALVKKLQSEGHKDLILVEREEVDLRNQAAVFDWFAKHRPSHVFHAAGKVGGIQVNSRYPADFLYENLAIDANILEASHRTKVDKLLYFGSSCIYPRDASQPLQESALLTGSLEPTNEAYALAKIAGIKLCESYRTQHGCDFIAAMPANLYGPNDNFGPESSHVIPALIHRFHEARCSGRRDVEVWGSGSAQREFLHVNDLADAAYFLMRCFSEPGHINVGTGREISIRELANTIGQVVHPSSRIVFDTSKPEGMPRKVLDVARLTGLGWTAPTGLDAGIASTYDWFCQHIATNRND